MHVNNDWKQYLAYTQWHKKRSFISNEAGYSTGTRGYNRTEVPSIEKHDLWIYLCFAS